jgi:hypothetical protein
MWDRGWNPAAEISMEIRVFRKVCGAGAILSVIASVFGGFYSEDVAGLGFISALMFVLAAAQVAQRDDYQVIPWGTVANRIGIGCSVLVLWTISVWAHRSAIPLAQPVLLAILLPFWAVAVRNHVAHRKQPPQVFINYARADKESVLPLFQMLGERGIRPWLDAECIPPGTDWDYQIKHAIWRSDFFLACLTANSVDRAGVLQTEIDEALKIWNEKSVAAAFLIPVRLEECPIPANLRRLQCVDLFAENGFDRLLGAVARLSDGK